MNTFLKCTECKEAKTKGWNNYSSNVYLYKLVFLIVKMVSICFQTFRDTDVGA